MSYVFPKARDVGDLSDKALAALLERADAGRLQPSVKLDGCTLVIGFEGSRTWMHSGTGNPVRSADAVVSGLREHYTEAFLRDTVWVGEVWSPGKTFPEISGDFRRHATGAYEFHVFDFARHGWRHVPYHIRMGEVGNVDTEVIKRIRQVPADLIGVRDLILSGGAGLGTLPGVDGIVLHDMDAPYAEGRSKRDVIKIKPTTTLDLEVVGTTPGLGKHAGKIGALVCRGTFGQVSVGTGLSDWDRLRTDFVGRVIEVGCLGVNPSGVPREPRYIRDRPDKDKTQVS